MTPEVCGDNRFEIIEKAKQAIIESTNIETSPEEMAVLDNILFRCWQMGWIDKYGNQPSTDGDTISRQDAVKEIDSFCGEVWTESEADFARGLGAALSIVESLPSVQPSGDLISRESALAEFRDGRDVYDIMESIEELPSAPDSRQRGVWVKDPSYNGVRFVPVCSNCGKRPPRIEVGGKLVGGYGAEATGAVWRSELEYHQSDFCPSCGADMKGQNDGQKR